MRSERGQAAIEWVTLVLVCSIVLGALATFVPVFDGRSFGGFLSHTIVCAITANCDDGDGDLATAYGPRDAALVRRYAPGLVYEPGEKELPVDWRSCRLPACANAPDDRDLDTHRSRTGEHATMFTHVVHRGGRTYIQYWFYYPDSNSTVLGSDKIWKFSGGGIKALTRLVTGKDGYPGFHLDDWEGFEVRVNRDGSAQVRATTHGGWQWCKSGCKRMWGPHTGWTRVSRGSHSGHVPTEFSAVPKVPGHGLHERTSSPDAVRLVPLETVHKERYRPLAPEVTPPWLKDAWKDPATDHS